MDYEWHDKILAEEASTILECLGPDHNRILSIEKTDKGYRISEECDGYYGVTLSQNQFERFIQELQKLSKS